jgi:hypothetical protein
MQKILRVGACSIFLMVPEEDLKTASVTIWSSLICSTGYKRPWFIRKEKLSKVEKPDD